MRQLYKCTVFYTYIVRKNGKREEWKGWLSAYIRNGMNAEILKEIRTSPFADGKEGFEITSWSSSDSPTFFEE